MVTFSLEDKLASSFVVNSLLLEYDLTKEKIDMILGKTFSYHKTYGFSADSVRRHILHPKFSGNLEFSRGEKKFQQKFSFDVPYFQVLTSLDLSFLDTSFPTDYIINIVNNQFTNNNNLSRDEQVLLTNIK